MRLAPSSTWIGKPQALARLATGVRNAAATPLTILGSALVGWWNADSASKITIATGVSHWLDEIGGYDLVQATVGAQPAWSASSFNGRGGVTFDGADDFLRLASTPASFPIGTNTSEIWAAVSQSQAGASPGITNLFNYGGTTSTPVRAVQRTVSGSANISRLAASSATATNSADFSGRHYLRAVFANGDMHVDQDGVVGTSAAPTLTTTAANTTMGGSNAATAVGFFNGIVHQVLVLNASPSAAQITALNAYFAARI